MYFRTVAFVNYEFLPTVDNVFAVVFPTCEEFSVLIKHIRRFTIFTGIIEWAILQAVSENERGEGKVIAK